MLEEYESVLFSVGWVDTKGKKQCSVCFEWKSFNSFSKKLHSLQSRCKSCNKKYYYSNIDRIKKLPSYTTEYRREYRKLSKAIYTFTKSNAKTRGIKFKLDKEKWIEKLNTATECELTGIKFDVDYTSSSSKNPYRPSLDRIDAKGIYEDDNVRIVCSIVNMAISDYGTELFDKMCLARVEMLKK